MQFVTYLRFILLGKSEAEISYLQRPGELYLVWLFFPSIVQPFDFSDNNSLDIEKNPFLGIW